MQPKPERRKAPPTIKHVARAAGVSLATVSRVLNESPLVAPERAAAVKAVMARLGYQAAPPERRRGYRRNRTPWLQHQAVGLVLAAPQGFKWVNDFAPVYSYALHGASAALQRHGLNGIIHHAPDLPALERMLQMVRADGYLFIGWREGRPYPSGLARFPAISMLGLPAALPWGGDTVTYDNAMVGRLAAEHLLARGVRHAAIIGNLPDTRVSRTRTFTFVDRMTEEGGTALNLNYKQLELEGPQLHMVNETVLGGLLDRMLAATPTPTGLFVTADIFVRAVYRQLAQRGLRPGQDIAVVGCNNEMAFLTGLHPQPAVVDIQAEVIGDLAVEQLLWRLQNPGGPRRTLLIAPQLVVPDSEPAASSPAV